MNATTEEAIEIIKMQSYGYSNQIPYYLKSNGIDAVIAYHITKVENVDGIKRNGIKAYACEQSYTRPDATYFFLDRDDISKNLLNILGECNQYAIITLHIPAKQAVEIRDDGLYNGTFSNSYSAAQYRGDIPAKWIKSIEIVK